MPGAEKDCDIRVLDPSSGVWDHKDQNLGLMEGHSECSDNSGPLSYLDVCILCQFPFLHKT